jgi:hypothetical protein
VQVKDNCYGRIVLFGLQGWHRAAFCQSLRAGCLPQICFVASCIVLNFWKLQSVPTITICSESPYFFVVAQTFPVFHVNLRILTVYCRSFDSLKATACETPSFDSDLRIFNQKLDHVHIAKSISGCVLVEILQKEKHQKQKTKWNAPSYNKHTLKKRTLFAIISYV